jgi:hypothetical protein
MFKHVLYSMRAVVLSGMWRFSPTSSWNVFSDCAVYVVLYAKLVSSLSIPSCRYPSHMTILEPPLYVPVRGSSMVSLGWGHGIRKDKTTTLVFGRWSEKNSYFETFS